KNGTVKVQTIRRDDYRYQGPRQSHKQQSRKVSVRAQEDDGHKREQRRERKVATGRHANSNQSLGRPFGGFANAARLAQRFQQLFLGGFVQRRASLTIYLDEHSTGTFRENVPRPAPGSV